LPTAVQPLSWLNDTQRGAVPVLEAAGEGRGKAGGRPLSQGGDIRNRRPRPEGPTQDTEEVDDMAASLVIEEEFGTTTGWSHAHNGYWAGDFSAGWTDQPPSSLHDARRTTSASTLPSRFPSATIR